MILCLGGTPCGRTAGGRSETHHQRIEERGARHIEESDLQHHQNAEIQHRRQHAGAAAAGQRFGALGAVGHLGADPFDAAFGVFLIQGKRKQRNEFSREKKGVKKIAR